MNSFNKLLVLTITTIILSACASTPKSYTTWHKEGATKQSVKDKIGHCRVEVGATDLSEKKAKQLVGYCMKSEGYRLETFNR